MKVVLATTNQGKVRELVRIFAESAGDLPSTSTSEPAEPGLRSLELLSLAEVTRLDYEVEETGSTFDENAKIKAFAAVSATGLPALAEDSGIEVDALGGAPGVYSARFAGETASDQSNNDLLLERLSAVPWEARTARFVSTLVLAIPTHAGPLLVGQGRGVVEGRIVLAPRGSAGFGYDPLFEPLDCPGRTTAEMTLEEKNVLSHRGAAARALLPQLLAWLKKEAGAVKNERK